MKSRKPEQKDSSSTSIIANVPPVLDWKSRIWTHRSDILALIALIFSYWSYTSADRSAMIAQQTLDRSVGLIQAQVSIKKVISNLDEFPKEKLVVQTDDDGVRFLVKLKNVDDLRLLNHVLTVENIGNEPVDAIRVETRTISAKVIIPKDEKPKKEDIQHIVVKQANILDYNLNTKLFPKGTVHISIIRNILEAIIDTQNPKQLNRDHTAIIQINCFGKLVGNSSYDAAKKQNSVNIHLCWDPSGFKDEIIRKQLIDYLAVPTVKNSN